MTNETKVTRVQMRLGKEEVVLETGRMAKQADGSVMVQYGGTVVLVSVVLADEPKEGRDFLPLTVEYQEKMYAAGRIPGGFFKREGRPSEKEILTARLVDRPTRPLFPKGFRNEIQIIALVLSHDGSNDPDVLAILGASAALGLAGAPTLRVGACRVGRVNGEFVVNPTYAELEQGDLDLVVASTSEGVIMVEAGAKEVPEEAMAEAIRFGQEQGLKTIALQEQLLSQAGPRPARTFPIPEVSRELQERIRRLAESRLEENLKERSEKEGGEDGKKALVAEILAQLQPTPPAAGEEGLTGQQVGGVVADLERSLLRKAILEQSRRVDGRDRTAVRPIDCAVGVLPRTHGSGLFTRGQTQSLTSATLGTGDDEQMIDAVQGKWFKTFMLHYSFPPFSVGEIRPVRGPGRREIGHGALAERSLRAIMPSKEEFPYTVRVVSEILESNGSSSMATACGATLALMDAGVPIKSPISGIAMGLVKEGSRYAILTDIIGLEDHYGDMDFKVSGTAKGITGLQLDLKLNGVPVEILAEALQQAKPARAHVLERMLESIAAPRTELSPYAPRITILKINPEKIGELIGPGGKTIRKLTQETGVSIDVEDDGTVKVACADAAAAKKAIDFIQALSQEAEVGRVYQGVVKRITNFGAFCEIGPGKEGLCHVSELSEQFVPKVEDVVKLGDTLAVKVVEIDAQGRINLSHKQALQPDAPPTPPVRRPGGGGGRPRGRFGEERGRHGPGPGGDREFRRPPEHRRAPGPGFQRDRDRGGHRGPPRHPAQHSSQARGGPGPGPGPEPAARPRRWGEEPERMDF